MSKQYILAGIAIGVWFLLPPPLELVKIYSFGLMTAGSAILTQNALQEPSIKKVTLRISAAILILQCLMSLFYGFLSFLFLARVTLSIAIVSAVWMGITLPVKHKLAALVYGIVFPLMFIICMVIGWEVIPWGDGGVGSLLNWIS